MILLPCLIFGRQSNEQYLRVKFETKDLNPQGDFLISKIGGELVFLRQPRSPQSANEHSITWIKRAKTFITRFDAPSLLSLLKKQPTLNRNNMRIRQFYLAKTPKLTFARICKVFRTTKSPDHTPKCRYFQEGPHHRRASEQTVIGKSTIGANCEIRANTIIGDEVTIGENVLIDYGAILLTRFWLLQNQENQIESFPIRRHNHRRRRDIGANTTIDRGTLDDTVIGNGSKTTTWFISLTTPSSAKRYYNCKFNDCRKRSNQGRLMDCTLGIDSKPNGNRRRIDGRTRFSCSKKHSP